MPHGLPHARTGLYAALAFAAALLLPQAAHAAGPADGCKPAYVGQLVTAMNPDGRTMTLTAPYAFGDGHCVLWTVPKGATIDGASIPKLFWFILGGPFEGKYRNASVIHDWYCDRRDQPWQKVHRMFYEGMLASGVDEQEAKLMYLAVYYGGPRWDAQAVANNRLSNKALPKGQYDPALLKQYKEVANARDSDLSAGVRYIAERIEGGSESLDDIDRLAEQARAIDGLSDAKAPK